MDFAAPRHARLAWRSLGWLRPVTRDQLPETLPGRDYVLFDSFEGLPPAAEIDGENAIAWQADTTSPEYFDNCTAGEEVARDSKRDGCTRAVHDYLSQTQSVDKLRSTPRGVAYIVRR